MGLIGLIFIINFLLKKYDQKKIDSNSALGVAMVAFENIDYGTQLSLCKRYYWQVDDNYNRKAGYKRHDINVYFEFTSPVPMRTTPTPTLSDGGIFTNYQSQYGSTQSSHAMSEWQVNIGQGLVYISSNRIKSIAFPINPLFVFRLVEMGLCNTSDLF